MRKNVKDFKVVITEDEKGHEKKEAVYEGKFFDVTMDEKELINFRRISLVLLVLIITVHIAGGCVANQGMYAFFVAVPYIFCISSVVFHDHGNIAVTQNKA